MVKPTIPIGKSVCCDYCWDFAPMVVPDHPHEEQAAGIMLHIWGWMRDFEDPDKLICPICVKKYGFVQILPPESTF